MNSKQEDREVIDAAIAPIDSKLAAGSEDDEQLQQERRDLEAARETEESAST